MISQVVPLHLPPGDTSTERNVFINGTKEQIEAAKELVNEVISGVSSQLLLHLAFGAFVAHHNINSLCNFMMYRLQYLKFAGDYVFLVDICCDG